VSGQISPALAGIPERVYVPDEISGDVVVIDPATFKIVRRFKTGLYPEHITPDWDLSRLLVSNMNSSTLTIIDPRTSRPSGTIKVPIPYAVYFTLDGAKAVVVNDLISPLNIKRNGLYFYDRRTWRVLKFVQIPYPGADDLDMSADGRYLMVSCEYSGRIAKVDTRSMRIVGSVKVGSLPRDVRLAPDGRVFFVANEGLNLVQVVDPVGLKVVASIPTGAGTHGLEFSRDATRLYVNNRTAGTITVIDVATLRVITTWRIGGSPDEMVLSPDGTRLWISNRHNGGVSVVDTRSGKVLATIATGDAPHGLTYWPQPGSIAVGQNGNMR
jgi:YVTN family beta-propeller protein